MEDSSARTFSESARVFTYFIYVSATARLTIDFTKKKKKKKYSSVDIRSTYTLFLNHLYFTRKKKERFSRKYGNTNHVLPFVKNSIVGKDPLCSELDTRI